MGRGGGICWRMLAGMTAGTAALYTLGTAWFMLQSGQSLWQVLGLCVLSFLPGDAMKMAAVMILTPALRRAVKRMERKKTALSGGFTRNQRFFFTAPSF